MTAPVTLRRARPEDTPALLALRIRPDQRDQVGEFAEWPEETRDTAHLHVIEAGAPVGFFRIDPAFDTRDPRLPKGAHGLRGLLIDEGRQGQGIGRAAFAQLPDYLRASYPDLAEVWLTVDTWNAPALRLYKATGWQDGVLADFPGRTGPEPVFRLPLRPY